MGIFHYNEDNKSYIYPILKIIVCIVLIILFINSERIIHIDNKVISIIIGILCGAITIVCIYCIYISVFEISQAHENRAKETVLSNSIIANSKQYTIDEIVFMAETNDIIEVQIISKNRIVNIGSSSDSKNGSSKFFDKLYYIDDEMFESINDFKSELLSYAVDGQISVIYIDGIVPK